MRALKKLMLRSHILRIKNHGWALLLLRPEYSASFNTKQYALFKSFFYSVLALVNNEKLYKTISYTSVLFVGFSVYKGQ